MSSRTGFFDRLARPRVLVLLFVLEVMLLGSVNGFDFPLSVPFMIRTTGSTYLDMCAFCTAPQVYSELDAFGGAGRQLQLLLLVTIDVLIPVASGLFGIVGLRVLAPPRLNWLWWVPVAALFLDFAENAGIASLVLQYPRHLNGVAGFTGLLSGLKFCAYGLTAVSMLVFAIARGLNRLTRRRLPSRV